MGSWLLPSVVIILGVIFTIITIIIAIKITQATKKIDIPANATLIDISARSQFTEGYSFGLVKNQIPRRNGTVFIEFFPLDAEQGEDKPRPPLQSVIIGKQFLFRFARGNFSHRREYLKVVSRDPSDLPSQMRDTLEGNWEQKSGQLAFLERVYKKAITAGDESIYEWVTNANRGQIPRAYMSQMREELSEFRRVTGGSDPNPNKPKP